MKYTCIKCIVALDYILSVEIIERIYNACLCRSVVSARDIGEAGLRPVRPGKYSIT